MTKVTVLCGYGQKICVCNFSPKNHVTEKQYRYLQVKHLVIAIAYSAIAIQIGCA